MLAGMAAVIWSVRTLATGRLLAGHRPEFHALRVILVGDLWQSGQFIPRWVPELAGGLGYPLFIYYGWLSYALAAALHVLGMSPAGALNAITIAAALWQAAGAWALGRELGGRAGGWIAWALFAFAPYQLVNVFVRANFPEFVAGSFAPWALWAMLRAVKARDRWSLPLGAVLLAAIIVSHNISGLSLGTTITAAGLLCAFTLPAGARKTGAQRALLTAAAGVLLCAGFWLPVVAGRNQVNLAQDFQGYLSYQQHFLYPHQLVATGWGYGISVPGPEDTMPLQLGLAQMSAIALAAPLALAWAGRRSGRRRARLVGFALGAAVLAFLTTTWSAPVWAVVTPLHTLQFPWRLHLPGTLLVAAAGALAARVFAAAGIRGRLRKMDTGPTVAAVVALTLAALSFGYCKPADSYACDENCLRHLLDRGYYTTALNDEFRPSAATDLKAVRQLMSTDHAMLDGVPLPEARLPAAIDRGDFTLQARISQPGELLLPVFWFPGWSVAVDGVKQPAYPCAGSGALCTRVVPGDHQIAAAWNPTFTNHLGTAISLATLGALLVWARRRKCVAKSVL
jgi:hypothetical protein